MVLTKGDKMTLNKLRIKLKDKQKDIAHNNLIRHIMIATYGDECGYNNEVSPEPVRNGEREIAESNTGKKQNPRAKLQ